ncbi:MAG: carboxypeptidase regulatory-like domain-containing protein [Anaeromyxobacteraceae bacterium]
MRSRRLPLALAALGLLLLALWWFLRPSPSPSAAVGPGPAAQTSAAGGPATSPAGTAPAAGLPIRVASPSGPVDAEPASFEGRVVSRAGGPVPGAELTFSRAGAAASVRAGPDGAFSFLPPAEGRWLLQAVTATGFLPFAPEWGHSPVELDARPGLHVRGLEIHLAPAVTLAGKVVDGDGTPVAGAAVRLLGAQSEAALVPIADRFTSDASGAFSFVAPEGALLEARKDGYRPGRAEVDWSAMVNRALTIEVTPMNRRLPPAAAISGKVVARGGGPVAGALVTASHMRFGGEGAAAAQAVSGADGTFTLPEVEMGRYRVTARAEGRAPGSVTRVAPGTTDVVVELGPGSRLRGCVKEASSGRPVAPFTVMVFDRRGALSRDLVRSRSVVDPGGCYALGDLAPGPLAVVVAAPGYGPSTEVAVDLPEAGDAIADATLTPGGRASGRVVADEDGAAIAGARITVEGTLEGASSTFPALAEATSGADGGFELGGLPGRASLFVAAAGRHARILSGITAAPGTTAGPFEVRLRKVEPGEEPRVDLAGIGVVLSPTDDGLTVGGLAPGGSGAEAGLLRGDVLLAVDGRAVVDLGFAEAVNAIRGPEGTSVLLTLRRGQTTLDLRVVRRLVRG